VLVAGGRTVNQSIQPSPAPRTAVGPPASSSSPGPRTAAVPPEAAAASDTELWIRIRQLISHLMALLGAFF
jgi:hypothetical protein